MASPTVSSAAVIRQLPGGWLCRRTEACGYVLDKGKRPLELQCRLRLLVCPWAQWRARVRDYSMPGSALRGAASACGAALEAAHADDGQRCCSPGARAKVGIVRVLRAQSTPRAPCRSLARPIDDANDMMRRAWHRSAGLPQVVRIWRTDRAVCGVQTAAKKSSAGTLASASKAMQVYCRSASEPASSTDTPSNGLKPWLGRPRFNSLLYEIILQIKG